MPEVVSRLHGLPTPGAVTLPMGSKATISDSGGSLCNVSDPLSASNPGFVAVLYRQQDIKCSDYRGGLELCPYSKIIKMPDSKGDLGHSKKENASFGGVFLSPGGISLLAEIF